MRRISGMFLAPGLDLLSVDAAHREWCLGERLVQPAGRKYHRDIEEHVVAMMLIVRGKDGE